MLGQIESNPKTFAFSANSKHPKKARNLAHPFSRNGHESAVSAAPFGSLRVPNLRFHPVFAQDMRHLLRRHSKTLPFVRTETSVVTRKYTTAFNCSNNGESNGTNLFSIRFRVCDDPCTDFFAPFRSLLRLGSMRKFSFLCGN